MRRALYVVAAVCAIYAFGLLLYISIPPFFTTKVAINGQPMIWAEVSIGLSKSAEVAPLAIALAIVPLCLAFAYDRAERG
jgi:uncharacterized membrane protein